MPRRMPSGMGSSLMNRGLALLETPFVPRPAATNLATRAKPPATPHRTPSETTFRCSDSTPGGRNKNRRKSAKRRGFSVSGWSSNKPSRRGIGADEASLYKVRGEIPTVTSDLGLIVDRRADDLGRRPLIDPLHDLAHLISVSPAANQVHRTSRLPGAVGLRPSRLANSVEPGPGLAFGLRASWHSRMTADGRNEIKKSTLSHRRRQDPPDASDPFSEDRCDRNASTLACSSTSLPVSARQARTPSAQLVLVQANLLPPRRPRFKVLTNARTKRLPPGPGPPGRRRRVPPPKPRR